MIKREYVMRQIRPFIGGELIKVLTGLRRSGKSVMLELIKNEIAQGGADSNAFISYNFEEMKNAPLCEAEALYAEITRRISEINGKAYIFLDEIQEVGSWEKCINSLRAEFDCDIYITGSNAKLLSGELATYLAGRYAEFNVYPFSFAEFSEYYTLINPGADERGLFNKYIITGGMPYLGNLRYEPAPSRQYLNDLYSSVVLKDIITRNKVRDADLLTRILAYVFTNAGAEFSAASVSKYLNKENRRAAPETVMNYIKYIEDAFLLYRARRNDLMGKKLLSVNEKYYIADHGIREALFGGNERDINIILENIVYMELRRRGYAISVGKYGNKEIDFVCEHPGGRLYIQVTYLLAQASAIEREFGAFGLIRDNYPKYVLSLDEYDMSRAGIIHMNIRDFLLRPSG